MKIDFSTFIGVIANVGTIAQGMRRKHSVKRRKKRSHPCDPLPRSAIIVQ